MKKIIVTFLAVGFILASCAQPTSDDINTIVAVPEKTEEVKEEPKVDTSKDNKKEKPAVITPKNEVKKEEPKDDKWILGEKNENPDKGFKSTEFVYYPFGYDFPSYLNDSKLYSSGKIKLEFVETLAASNVDDSTVIFRNFDDHSPYMKINKYKVLISKDVTENTFLLCKGVGFNIYSGTDAHNALGFYQLKKVEDKWYLSQKQVVEDTISLYH